MTSRFDLVIFDCDGILVDSERLSVRLDVELLAQLGWPLSPDEIVEKWVGRTEAAMRAEIETHLGRDIGPEWDAFSHRYIQAFADQYRAMVQAHIAALGQAASGQGTDYRQLTTSRPLDFSLYEYLSFRDRTTRLR